MKLIVIAILNLLLFVISGKGQTGKDDLLGNYYKYKYIKPELKDSVAIRFNCPSNRFDSIRNDRIFHKKLDLRNQILNRRSFTEDDMAFDPGNSFDRMPNAVITTPGIHYLLKIVIPGRAKFVPFPRQR